MSVALISEVSSERGVRPVPGPGFLGTLAFEPSKHMSNGEVSTFRDNRHPDGRPDAEPNLKPTVALYRSSVVVSDCSWKLSSA
jgi:hypothetical protein